MPSETQPLPAVPLKKGAALCWREFCEQWRHSYLLLAVVFWGIWRASARPIEILEDTRMMGGLHPTDVFALMNTLELMWLPPLFAILLYASSFVVPKLNTSAAIALSALSSVALLAWILFWALIRINMSSF